jgi:hypothetical protein
LISNDRPIGSKERRLAQHDGRQRDAVHGPWRAAGVNREFSADTVRRILRARFEAKKQFLGGAHTISPVKPAAGGPTPPKFESIPEQAAIAFRERARILDRTSMQRTVERICAAIRGFGPFMAGQAVADLPHVVRGPWADRDTLAPMGRGSQRRLAWLRGRDGIGRKALGRLVTPASFLLGPRRSPKKNHSPADSTICQSHNGGANVSLAIQILIGLSTTLLGALFAAKQSSRRRA